jgi:hypothetical protein
MLYGIYVYTMNNYLVLGFLFVIMLTSLFIFIMLFNILNLVQLYSLELKCFIYNNIKHIVPKGYHGCKCCGPSIEVRWSYHLQKPMYECSIIFLP